jgi:lysyl-tRNA synthetase class 2
MPSNLPEDEAARDSDHVRARRAKLRALIEAGEEPYKIGFHRTHTVAEARVAAGDLPPGTETQLEVRVAGRLMAFRRQGKLVFCDLVDATGRLQLVAQADRLGEMFQRLDDLDVGDWIGAWGSMMTTRRGELSVALDGFQILSKSLRPLPEKWRGLRDVESRYRQRYLDLIANPESRHVLETRFETVASMRSWLMQRGFTEVETPLLQPVYGGALAKPFKTYHEALGMDLYLRVAPELYLKRLLVGGMERIFEINRSFRNEGVSVRHNPEFTMLELYQALSDYHDMANLLEALCSDMALKIAGSHQVPYGEHIINLAPPYRRVRMIELLRELGVDTGGDLAAQAARLGVVVDPNWSWGKVLLEIYEKKVERTLVQPTFVMDYPWEASPLARRHREDPRFTEHLDVVIAGMEVGVAYSELTDPLEQRGRFEAQARIRGDDEAHQMDEDFLKALEYGMPPTGGLGFGIDRFVMVLTDQSSIREVIAFPALRPEDPKLNMAELESTEEAFSSPAAIKQRSEPAAPPERLTFADQATIPELLVVGTGPVAAALVGLGEPAGFHVRVAAGPDSPRVGEFEGADEVIVTREPKDVEAIRPGANTYVVICSEIQEFAREVLRTLVPTPVPYLGMMANRKKTLQVYEELNQAGFTKDQIGRVHTPVGLNLGSETPEEIALSVLAEIVAVRRRARTEPN